MDKKVITLPATAAEIIERLKKVNDDSHMVANFYPMIAQEAGRELVAGGVVMMLTLKVYDFQQQGFPPIIGNLLNMQIPRMIDALVDDKDVATEAKAFYQEAADKARAAHQQM